MFNSFLDKALIVSIHAPPPPKTNSANIVYMKKRQYNKEMKCFNNHNTRLEVKGQHAKFICYTLHSFIVLTNTDLLLTGHNHAKGRQTYQRETNMSKGDKHVKGETTMLY